MRAVVVGGGLAGCAAALELATSGHEVTLLEARPTLGGVVQTLPEREGDPSPPPDNGQHIALGCFTEYLDFLTKLGQREALARSRLSLPVIDESGKTAFIKPSLRSMLRYSHLRPGARLRLVRTLLRLRRIDAGSCDDRTFWALLVGLGESEQAVWRFWDVFMRPALNVRSDEASAELAVMTVQTALLGPRRASDLVLPTAPLGEMHGAAARRKLESLGVRVKTSARVTQLIPGAAVLADGDRVQGDAFVVAVPPAESAGLLDEPDPELGKSPIVSVHLWFDRELLRHPLAALLGSDAHWVFDRGRLTGHPPDRGQYLTVVSRSAGPSNQIAHVPSSRCRASNSFAILRSSSAVRNPSTWCQKRCCAVIVTFDSSSPFHQPSGCWRASSRSAPRSTARSSVVSSSTSVMQPA